MPDNFLVFPAISIAKSSLEGSSVMITISAASMAASEPKPPIADVCPGKHGGSIYTSPTKTRLIYIIVALTKTLPGMYYNAYMHRCMYAEICI